MLLVRPVENPAFTPFAAPGQSGTWHGVVLAADLGGAFNSTIANGATETSDIILTAGYTTLQFLLLRTTGQYQIEVGVPDPSDLSGASIFFDVVGTAAANTRITYGAAGTVGTGNLFPWVRLRITGTGGTGATGVVVHVIAGVR